MPIFIRSTIKPCVCVLLWVCHLLQPLFVVVVVVVVVLRLTRIIKSVVPGQAPVTLEMRNTPKKHTHNPRWYTHISQLTQFMPPPETYKYEIGCQPTMCQVHTGAYVSLLPPGKTDSTACHPRKKDYHVYIARGTYHYAYPR